MTPRAVSLVRRMLLAGLLGVGVLVVGSLRSRPPAPAPAPPPGDAPAGNRIDGVVYRTFREGSEDFVIEAARWEGDAAERVRLEDVRMRFEFRAQGDTQPATVVADSCVYAPGTQKAEFEGNVHVTTGNGFEITTDRLDYDGVAGEARTTRPIEFSRKGVSGRAVGARYAADAGRLDLSAEVVVRIADPDTPTAVVTSGRAWLDRGEGLLRFEDGVVLEQGADRVEAGWLSANLTDDFQIYRAQFGEGVVARSGAGGGGSGVAAVPGPAAPRVLEGQRLDVWLRPDTRSLKKVVAGPDASLLLMPAAEPLPETRRLRARYLTFEFDAEGRLATLLAQKESVYESTPASSLGRPRRLTCQRFEARFEAGTSRIRRADFHVDVVYSDGPWRARADEAGYDARRARLTLRGAPRLEDVEEHSELFADDVYVNTSTGAVKGRDHVRHVLRGSDPALPGGPSGEPAILTCRVFDYDPALHELLYRDGALLRRGEDEVRAKTLRLVREASGGAGSLSGEGEVVSRLSGGGDQERIEASADRMDYDPASRQIVYVGDVSIRQGDVSTRSPRAVLDLDDAGAGLVRLVAGEPVEVRFGKRVARGRQGTYTTADRTMRLLGEDATLVEPDRELKGRSLTFTLGEDTILVEGREEVRTEMLIK